MTTPSNTWVRVRLPSITWKCTRTRSPAANCGRRCSCSFSRVWMIVLMASESGSSRCRRVDVSGRRRGSSGGDRSAVARRGIVAKTLRSPPRPAHGCARVASAARARDRRRGGPPARPIRGSSPDGCNADTRDDPRGRPRTTPPSRCRRGRAHRAAS